MEDIGERRLITEVIRPLFNPCDAAESVGDDCAIIAIPTGDELVTSTDRVPADLTAFRVGILDYRGLGDYLGRLNLSDIAASGGRPLGLLFNAGVPASMLVSDFNEICHGLRAAVTKCGCNVLGGDMSLSDELSLSATVFGAVPKGRCVLRRGARPGDAVVVTRSVGLTPAAFATIGSKRPVVELDDAERARLERQFTNLQPLTELGIALRDVGATSLMDNTDGLGQTLAQLSDSSGVAFIIDRGLLHLEPLVCAIATAAGEDPARFALGAGADLSLVGTVGPDALGRLPQTVKCIGRVESGKGLWLSDGGSREQLSANGWNYFASDHLDVAEETAA